MRAFLGLGSNVGKREDYLADAVSALSGLEKSRLLRLSSIYETDPWGNEEQRDFLNQALILETRLPPDQLLKACHDIEESLNRKREGRWHPRTIDIDILLLDDLIIREKQLQVPHPLLTKRRFALVPLSEIAEEKLIPDRGMTVGCALQCCRDPGRVMRFSSSRQL